MSSVTVKHHLKDWEQIAGENPEQAAALMLDVTMAPEKILIATDDHREIWIEFQEGKLVIHAYDGECDEPVNLAILPGNEIVYDDEEYRASK